MRYSASEYGVTLKTGLGQLRGCSRSLKMAPFDRPYATFYWSAIVNILYIIPFLSYLTLNNIVTLKSGLEVSQGHLNPPFESLGAISYLPSIVGLTMALSCIILEIKRDICQKS